LRIDLFWLGLSSLGQSSLRLEQLKRDGGVINVQGGRAELRITFCPSAGAKYGKRWSKHSRDVLDLCCYGHELSPTAT
jgi:hypothetical protein